MRLHAAASLTVSTSSVCLSLQEEIIPFFQKVELSPDNKDVFSCYLELAEKVGWELLSPGEGQQLAGQARMEAGLDGVELKLL